MLEMMRPQQRYRGGWRTVCCPRLGPRRDPYYRGAADLRIAEFRDLKACSMILLVSLTLRIFSKIPPMIAGEQVLNVLTPAQPKEYVRM